MSTECVNAADGTCVLPPDFRNRIKTEILGAWSIIENRFLRSKTDLDLMALSNEECVEIYKALIGVLTRGKSDGGYGYCGDCAKKAIEYFCTRR